MSKLIHYLNAPKNDFRATAFYCVSNWGGYEIEISRDGSSARIRASFGDKVSPSPRWQEIKYSSVGDPFVTFNGRRLMLDNFTRV